MEKVYVYVVCNVNGTRAEQIVKVFRDRNEAESYITNDLKAVAFERQEFTGDWTDGYVNEDGEEFEIQEKELG